MEGSVGSDLNARGCLLDLDFANSVSLSLSHASMNFRLIKSSGRLHACLFYKAFVQIGRLAGTSAVQSKQMSRRSGYPSEFPTSRTSCMGCSRFRNNKELRKTVTNCNEPLQRNNHWGKLQEHGRTTSVYQPCFLSTPHPCPL